MKNQEPLMNQMNQNSSQQQLMMSLGQQLQPQPPPVMNQPQQMMNSQMNNQFVNQLMNPMVANQPQPHRGGGGGYGMWPLPQVPQVDQLKYQNPNVKPMGPRSKNWKGKKGNDKWNNNIRKDLNVMGVGSSNSNSNNTGGIGIGIGTGSGSYNPPTLNELQQQNRLKARRYFPKKKFNHNGRSAPYAPRNTTSFLIRAKKSGGITSLVSPCPVTPAVLPTPIFSPSREVLVDMAKEEWGVDGYGSMKGLIRLRSPGNEADAVEDDEEDEGGSSESDVEEHVEVERRLDHDLSRFEMIYPNYNGADHSSYLLENRVDDQDTHIAQLEEENLILKERLFLMEREFDDLRMRLQCLERQSRGAERVNEEVVENDSENESESRGYGRSMEDNNEGMMENHEHSEDNNNNNNNNNNSNDGNNGDEKGMNTDVVMVENVDKVEETEAKKDADEDEVAGEAVKNETESKKDAGDDEVAGEAVKNIGESSSNVVERTEENANEEGKEAAKDEENAANE